MFTHNTAVYGAGGGLYCWSSVALFNGIIFEGNNAEWGGGAHTNTKGLRLLFSAKQFQVPDDSSHRRKKTQSALPEMDVLRDSFFHVGGCCAA